MRDKIHPKYVESTITCSCGNVIETKTSVGDMKIEICSACHPFYTGKQKLLDTAGRIEKYNRKYNLNPKK
jgi:large subunit ribosomal protein L31